MRQTADKTANKKSKATDSSNILRMKSIGNANKIAKKSRIESKRAEILKQIGGEANDHALFEILKIEEPLMTSTPQCEVQIIRKTGPLIMKPGDYVDRTGRDSSKRDLIEQTPKIKSTFISKRVKRELVTKGTQTDLKLGNKDNGLPDQHVSMKQQKNCVRNIVGKINARVAGEKLTQEKNGVKREAGDKVFEASGAVKKNRKVSLGKFAVVKDPGTTPPSRTIHALARAMSLRSSSTPISSSSSRLLSRRTGAEELHPMNGASGVFIEDSDQQMQLAEKVFPDDKNSEVKLFQCFKKFHCLCCDDVTKKYFEMKNKFKSFEVSFLKLSCSLIGSECMDGTKADLFITEIAGLMPNAQEYDIYWLAKAIVAQKLDKDPLFYFKEAIKHVKKH